MPSPSAQITSVQMDRLKVVTATDEYGEGPLRVWDRGSGALLAKLGSAPRGGSGSPRLAPSPAGPGEGHEEGTAGSEDEEEAAARAGWEGVTALACSGSLLVSGNSEGLITEYDFSRGALPGPGGESDEGERGLLGKFWRAVDVH